MKYVYVIGPAEGPLKVGISAKPRRRLSALQTASHAKLVLHHIRAVDDAEVYLYEADAHARLAKHALEGEWFDVSAETARQAVEAARPAPCGGGFAPGYWAIVHQSADAYGLSFPDLPGCVTAAPTTTALLVLATEALLMHLGGIRDDGERIPHPSPPESMVAECQASAGALAFVALPSCKVVRVNITLPEDALRAIDTYAEARGFTRSGFFTQAAKEAMADA
jgi:predicted RNase H-like HicB family nuclease